MDELNKKQVPKQIGDINETFSIYDNGTVTDPSGDEICEEGGEQCLNNYIDEQNKDTVIGSINNTNQTFSIYPNSTVTNSDGDVICQGG